MLRYRDGDVAAFETLYRRHKDALFRYLLRLCHQRTAAEDVFQEVWGKIIKSRDTYRPTAKFTTFLYHVAHNCFIDHLRRNKRHDDRADIDPDSRPGDGDCPERQPGNPARGAPGGVGVAMNIGATRVAFHDAYAFLSAAA